jgi:hypothetical protein
MKIITPSSRKINPQERLHRQAQALRDNLARRKDQSRARQDPPGDEDGADTLPSDAVSGETPAP